MHRPYADLASVFNAASAARNQAETMATALNEAIDRAFAFRAKLAARAAENS